MKTRTELIEKYRRSINDDLVAVDDYEYPTNLAEEDYARFADVLEKYGCHIQDVTSFNDDDCGHVVIKVSFSAPSFVNIRALLDDVRYIISDENNPHAEIHRSQYHSTDYTLTMYQPY